MIQAAETWEGDILRFIDAVITVFPGTSFDVNRLFGTRPPQMNPNCLFAPAHPPYKRAGSSRLEIQLPFRQWLRLTAQSCVPSCYLSSTGQAVVDFFLPSSEFLVRHKCTPEKTSIMSSRDISEYEKDVIEYRDTEGKAAGNPGLTQKASRPELKRVASDTLSKVASRLSTRDIIDPGPPPDGGLEAWIQVAMAWVVCFTTW